jgi:adenylosuccinate lyase
MKVWHGEGTFLNFLLQDKDVTEKLSADELSNLFDIGYHTKHVDTIFKRVFKD